MTGQPPVDQPFPTSFPTLPEEYANAPDKVRQTMAFRGMNESYYLATAILGYRMLRPQVHGPPCIFLDTCEARRRMYQDPRSHFKTTIGTVTHRIKRYLNRPWSRTLIVGDTEGNASNHLRKIKGHLENNAVFQWLYPDMVWENPRAQAVEWSKFILYCPTKAMHGEPTFTAIGARGAVVSQHFDDICADDIIGEDEYYSPTEMARTIEWFSGLEALFVPPAHEGLMDIPSTHWKTNDVYSFAEEFYGRGQEAIQTGPFSYQRGEIAVFRRGARDEDGNPIFPQAVSREYLDRLQETNPERYAAQYANNPYASGVAYFDQGCIRYYDWHIIDRIVRWTEAGEETPKTLNLEGLYIVSFCDPHAGGKVSSNPFIGSRAAVITTAVSTRHNRIFVLDAWIKKAPTNIIIDEIFRQNEKWLPQAFSIEANGLQKMLRYWIDERVERDNKLPIPYVAYMPKGDKDGERRIKGLQPLFRAHQILMLRGMSELIGELNAYPNGMRDGLDALSQGLQHWNVGFEAVEQEILDAYEQEIFRQRSAVTGY